MRKYLYTTLFLTLLAQGGVMAQDNNTSKGGFFGKLKDTFSTEIKIGNYTFKDGSVYTGEMKDANRTEKGKRSLKMGMSTKGNISKENVKATESILFRMERSTKVSGSRISNTEKESIIL